MGRHRAAHRRFSPGHIFNLWVGVLHPKARQQNSMNCDKVTSPGRTFSVERSVASLVAWLSFLRLRLGLGRIVFMRRLRILSFGWAVCGHSHAAQAGGTTLPLASANRLAKTVLSRQAG